MPCPVSVANSGQLSGGYCFDAESWAAAVDGTKLLLPGKWRSLMVIRQVNVDEIRAYNSELAYKCVSKSKEKNKF